MPSFFFFFFDRSHYVGQAGLGLELSLPQFSKCRNYRCAPLHPTDHITLDLKQLHHLASSLGASGSLSGRLSIASFYCLTLTFL
jgi:hypothetical protein